MPKSVRKDFAIETSNHPSLAPQAAKPRIRTIVAGHVVFTLLNAVLFANVMWLMPMLVRLRFGADDPSWRDWQTTLVTASLPTFLLVSVFWGELLQRISLKKYLILYWIAAAIPLCCVSLVQNYWQFLVCHIVSAAGVAGWLPIQGHLLQHFYPSAVRGRAFAVLRVAQLVSTTITAYLVGKWLEADPEAFRLFFVVGGVLQIIAMGILVLLIRSTGASETKIEGQRKSLASILEPVLHMGRTLRGDRIFLQYEIAFMVYGAAFMFCDALLPVLATQRMGMGYEDYSQTTAVACRAAMLFALLPMGLLMDRIGPVRVSALSFGILAAFPVLLMIASGPAGVAVACVIQGIALAGVTMGWFLGPVSLAPTKEQVPRYVAIHATMVGVRGVVCQGMGMLLFKISGTFEFPLILAAIFFASGAMLMWKLHVRTAQEVSDDIPAAEDSA